MPLGKKKHRKLMNVLNLMVLLEARCNVNEHARTTVQLKEIQWILQILRDIST